MAPLHYYNPYYLRLDLKTHSTRLLHSSIQQTSVDATPEHHAAVVSGLTAAGVLLPEPEVLASAPAVPSLLQRSDHRSCSIASTGKKTVAFADTVDVCGGGDDDDEDDDDDIVDINHRLIAAAATETAAEVRIQVLPAPVVRPRSTNVLQVHSQTGEVVGDLLIERKRDPPPSLSPPSTATNTATPSPVDDDPSTCSASGSNRRKRHEMFCRRRQSPVYSCDDGAGETAYVVGSPAADSASSSSVYESCDDDLSAVVVLGAELGRPPLRRSAAAAVHGYAGCCPS
ncbi:unnamed protein product [Macrosiphum euphorbiae]|uniref:Uncharacterized protein n=2 Tax=Macrosiphum euphorbiae TaxID=13131 RepID=A0AAV0W711_9HEMI|nr:unnamed protein product [Macrosiphum euphorbiae]